MAQGLNPADRVTLRTTLSKVGVSSQGAVQIANAEPVTDPADREILAQLICTLLSESPAGSGLFQAFSHGQGKKVKIAW